MRHLHETAFSQGRAVALTALGRLELDRGDIEVARDHFLEALRCAESMQAPWPIARALVWVSDSHTVAGDGSTAVIYLRRALQVVEKDPSPRAKAFRREVGAVIVELETDGPEPLSDT